MSVTDKGAVIILWQGAVQDVSSVTVLQPH